MVVSWLFRLNKVGSIASSWYIIFRRMTHIDRHLYVTSCVSVSFFTTLSRSAVATLYFPLPSGHIPSHSTLKIHIRKQDTWRCCFASQVMKMTEGKLWMKRTTNPRKIPSSIPLITEKQGDFRRTTQKLMEWGMCLVICRRSTIFASRIFLALW
jgi:hypothetical protein